MLIENETNGRQVCARARLARNLWSRLRGLLGARVFGPGDGLLIEPASAVHTIGMAIAIDVVALDRRGHVLAVRPDLKPGRLALFNWKTHSVLELPAGQIARSAISVGDALSLSVIVVAIISAMSNA